MLKVFRQIEFSVLGPSMFKMYSYSEMNYPVLGDRSQAFIICISGYLTASSFLAVQEACLYKNL